jgi:elongation factor G
MSAHRRWRIARRSPAGTSQDYTHKKQTGGTGQFARVKIVFEPQPDSSGFVFETKIVGGAVPKEYIPGVEKGLNSVMTSGRGRGLPRGRRQGHADRRRLPRRRLVGAGLRNRLARGASAKRCRRASVLLEPIMKVEVVTPEDYTGSVIGDLNSRRGQIQGQDMRGNANVINAMVHGEG